MKKAIIIHGWDGNPNEPLHRYVRGILEKLGYRVIVPKMPNPEVPVIKDWIEQIETSIDPETSLMIGHSIGCQAILRYIEHTRKSVDKVILIAPWMKLDENTLKEEGEEVIEIARPWEETPINFDLVKDLAKEFFAIFSDNDPYVPLSEKDFFEEKLGAKTYLEKNQGHFTGLDSFTALQTDLRNLV